MNLQQALAFVAEHSDDDDLDHVEIDAAFTAIFGREPDDVDRELGLWSLMVEEANNHSELAAIFVNDPGDEDQGRSLWSMVVAATDEDPSCGDDEDEDEEPYFVDSTLSGWAVIRMDGQYAEFVDYLEAEEAAERLNSGLEKESEYYWSEKS